MHAIVGGAVLPPLTGWVADAAGLAGALFVPVACYLAIAGYGWATRRPVASVQESLAPLAPPAGG